MEYKGEAIVPVSFRWSLTVDNLFQYIKHNADNFDCGGVAIALRESMHRTKISEEERKQLIQMVSTAACKRLDELDDRAVSSLLYAQGHYNVEVADEDVGQICEYVVSHGQTFRKKSVALSLYGLAKMGYPDVNDVFSKFVNTFLEELDRWESQQMCYIVWSYAKVGHYNSALFNLFKDTVISRLYELKADELAMLAWSFARVQHTDEHFFETLGDLIIQEKKIEKMSTKGLSALLWAFATLKKYHLPIFREVGERSLEQFKNFQPEEISNLLWAMASVGHKSDLLFLKFSKRIVSLLPNFTSQEIVNLVWCYAKFDLCYRELFYAVARGLAWDVGKLSTYETATVMWAYSRVNYRDANMMQQMAKHINENMDLFAPKDFSNVIWSFASLGVFDELEFELVKSRAIKLFAQRGTHQTDFINTAWGLSVLELWDSMWWDFFVKKMNNASEFSKTELVQLQNVFFLVEAALKMGKLKKWKRPEENNENDFNRKNAQAANFGDQLETARDSKEVDLDDFGLNVRHASMKQWLMFQQGNNSGGSGAFVNDIYRILKELGADGAIMKYPVREGVLYADIGVNYNEQLVAVQADQPQWFSSNRPHYPLGRWVARRRMFEGCFGWKVVSVSSRTWDDLEEDSDKKVFIIQKLNEECGFLQPRIGSNLNYLEDQEAQVLQLGIT